MTGPKDMAEDTLLGDALDFIEAQEYAGAELVWDWRPSAAGQRSVCLDCGAEKGNPHDVGGCWWLAIMRKAGRRAP